MGYYTALVTKFNSLTGTDAARIAAINALAPIATGVPAKALLTPSAILNAIVPADLASLTTAQVTLLTLVLQGSTVDASVGSTVRAAIVSIFSGKATTIANLGALVAGSDSPTLPWWQTPVAQGGAGLNSPVTQNDVDAFRALAQAITDAQAKLAADQAALVVLQNATPVVPAAVAAMQATIANDTALIAQLQAK